MQLEQGEIAFWVFLIGVISLAAYMWHDVNKQKKEKLIKINIQVAI